MKESPLKEQCLLNLGDRPLFPAELARRIGRAPGAVARVLDSLERDGLVKGELKTYAMNFSSGVGTMKRAYRRTDAGATAQAAK